MALHAYDTACSNLGTLTFKHLALFLTPWLVYVCDVLLNFFRKSVCAPSFPVPSSQTEEEIV